ncbi:MAG: outer membrane protein assembly factor BamE [Formivibrio sp.]|nr:outer membrane protein assembly factor BamE [Formivibrio sp.]
MAHRLLLVIIATILAVGCTFPNVVSPYKLDIPQGNAITADKVAQLKAGMTRSQVRFVLGTPLLADPFHANRWDYVFTEAKDARLIQKKKFTVFFENDNLTRFEGDTLPAAKPILALEASTPNSAASSPAAQKE